jgi:hypothetical protein
MTPWLVSRLCGLRQHIDAEPHRTLKMRHAGRYPRRRSNLRPRQRRRIGCNRGSPPRRSYARLASQSSRARTERHWRCIGRCGESFEAVQLGEGRIFHCGAAFSASREPEVESERGRREERGKGWLDKHDADRACRWDIDEAVIYAAETSHRCRFTGESKGLLLLEITVLNEV